MKVRYAVNFWIRLLIRLIDFGYPFAFQLGLVFVLTRNDGFGRLFVANYGFYVWCCSGALLLFFSCLIVPLILPRQTLGMFLTRTMIETDKPLLVALLKREAFFSLAWTLMFLLAMALLNHTLVNKFAQPTRVLRGTFSNWENVRIGLLSSLSSFMLVAQFCCGVSLIVNSNHLGLHDRLSKTRTVWQRRYRVIKTTKVLYLAPRPANNVNIKWVTRNE